MLTNDGNTSVDSGVGDLDDRSEHPSLAVARATEDIQFPMPLPRQSMKMTRTRTFLAWVGNADRVRRVAMLAEDALRRAFVDARATVENAPKPTQERLLGEFSLVARVEGAGDLERTGSLDSILGAMDTGDIRSVELRNQRVESSIAVRFARDTKWPGPSSGGVFVQVVGSDAQWVVATFETLVGEIAKDVPWWSALRTQWIGKVVAGLAIVGAGAVAPWLLKTGVNPVNLVLGAAVLGVLCGLLVSGAASPLVRRVLVPFEVLAAGQRSTASRVGGRLLATIALASALLGIWAALF